MLDLRHIDRMNLVRFFTHLIVIIMIFFLPDMMMKYGRPFHDPYWDSLMYIKAAAFVAVFYLNYYVILKRTLFRSRPNYLAFIGWNLLVVVCFIGLIYYVLPQLWQWPDHPRGGRHHHEIPRRLMMLREWSYILRDIGMLVLTIGLSTALRFAERWAKIEKRHQQLIASQQAEELQNLKNQINPHFLFNTLNTIYSLIEIDPRQAQDAIHQLSRLLRTALYDSPAAVPLAQEVDFARSYISLMEMRLGQGVVHADFTGVTDTGIEVAPMLFVTLIENAFKHGNTGVRGQQIEISISSGADGTVVCRTFNHFAPKEEQHQSSSTGFQPVSSSKSQPVSTSESQAEGGIGLINLRRRLHLIYGDNASLSTRIDGDTYTAVLTIKNQKDK